MIGKKYDERKSLCVCPAHRIEVYDRLKAYRWLEYGASFFTGHCVVCRCPSDQKVLFVRRTR